MDLQPANVTKLTKYITWEILGAFNLPRSEFWQRTIGPLFHQPARRFSEIFATFDQNVYEHGLSEACRRLLPHFVDGVASVGNENVPAEGPVLLCSNHPGTVDGVSIVACTTRDDTKVIVGGMPFLQSLPVAKHATIASSRENFGVRANVIRSSIQHLENGGAVLIFPSGLIDPDPAILPGAREALDKWSKSITLMLRRVPETRFVPVITSGVLHEKFARTPLTFLKKDGVGKRRIMEFIQIMRQLVFEEKLGLKPLITFGESVTLQDLGLSSKGDSEKTLQTLIEQARSVLERHVALLGQKVGIDR